MVFRLLLLVDRPIVRDGIKALFEAATDILIVGEEAAEHAELVSPTCPDVVLIDEHMLDRGGWPAVCAMFDFQRTDPVGVVVLAGKADSRSIDRAVRAGARGYLLEDDETWLLIAGLKAVASGHASTPGR